MSRYRFELVDDADCAADADLRRILAETPMAGQIAVSFRREPSYFAAAVADGGFRQVIGARDCETGHLVAFGSRSVRSRYVNGRPEPVGYLGNLRVLENHRNRGVVARGYRFMRELHGDGRTALYLTTIAAGNELAIRVLTSGRAGLPKYHPLGDLHTLAIPLRSRARGNAIPPGLTIRQAVTDDLPAILAFLAASGSARQFFPCYTADDFFTSTSAFRDLQPADLWLAHRDGRLVGTLGGWDQHRFRQSVVHDYGSAIRWSRPLYNALAKLRGRPPLPATGELFRYLVGALPLVADNDPAVFQALLDSLLHHVADGAGSHLLLGLHTNDPLLPVARAYQTTCYTTHVYLVCWEDGEEIRNRLDDRPAYLELGSL
jgi:hypothetical protein